MLRLMQKTVKEASDEVHATHKRWSERSSKQHSQKYGIGNML